MGSRVVMKQIVGRSLFQFCPAVATTGGGISIINGNRRHDSAGGFGGQVRSLTTTSHEVFNPLSLSLTRALNLIYKRFTLPSTTCIIRPARSHEDTEFLYLYLHMSPKSGEDVKVSVEHNTIYVEAKDACRFIKYVSWIDLPNTIYKTTGITAELTVNIGELQLTIPKLKQEEVVYDVKVKSIYDE